MKKLLLGLFIGLGLTALTAYAATSFRSDQVGSSPASGKVLQTNGTTSTWVATSTLGIQGSGGSGNSAWTIGNSVIYNATSTDFVGIGTYTPTSELQVNGTTTTNNLFVHNNGATNNGIYFEPGGAFPRVQIKINDPTTPGTQGNDLTLYAANAVGDASTTNPLIGGDIIFYAGTGQDAGAGGNITALAGAAQGPSGNGGTLSLRAGSSYHSTGGEAIISGGGGDLTGANGGDLTLLGGYMVSGGTPGVVRIQDPQTGFNANLLTTSLAASRNFTFPDASGTLCITTTCAGTAAFTIGSGNIYNATSTDLVGIGTITPTTTLFVQGKGGTNPFTIVSSTGTTLLQMNQSGQLLGRTSNTGGIAYGFLGAAASTTGFSNLTSGVDIAVYVDDQDVFDFLSTSVKAKVQLQGTNSGASAPGYGFILDTGTGMYDDQNDQNLKFATNGVLRMTIGPTGSTTIANLGTGCVGVSSGSLYTTTCGTGGSGNSAWTIGNGLIYNATSTDFVGVGTITPTSTLFVQGKGGTNPFTVTSSTGVQLLNVTQAGSVQFNALITVIHANGTRDNYTSTSTASATANGTALLRAMANAVTGDTVYLAANTFDIGPGTIDLSIGNTGSVSLIGAGKYTTIVQGTTSTPAVLIYPATNSVTSDMKILGTNASSSLDQFLWGSNNSGPGGSFTNATLRHVYMSGKWDGVFINNANDSGTIIDLTCVTNFDCINIVSTQNETWNIYDSDLTTVADPAVNGGTVVRGISAKNSTTVINVYNTKVSVSGGSSWTYAYHNQLGSPTMNIYGGYASSSGATALDLANSSGTMRVTSNTVYDTASTTGTINILDANPTVKAVGQSTLQFGIGTITPLSELYVQGASSRPTADILILASSSAINLLKVSQDSTGASLRIYNQSGSEQAALLSNSQVNANIWSGQSGAMTLFTNLAASAADGINIGSNFNLNPTSGQQNLVSLNPTVNSTSGTADVNQLTIEPTYSLGANTKTITRGLYVSPVNNMATYDYRDFEVESLTRVVNTTTPPSTMYSVVFGQAFYKQASAATITNASTLNILGAPTVLTNMAITSSTALTIGGLAVGAKVVNAYGLWLQAPTGALNNYAAVLTGGNVGIGSTAPGSLLAVQGTAGATINLFTIASSSGTSFITVAANGSTTLSTLGTGCVGVTAGLLYTTSCAGATITSLNGLSGASQTFATTTSGTLWTITSSGTVHTWNIPSSPTFTGTSTLSGAVILPVASTNVLGTSGQIAISTGTNEITYNSGGTQFYIPNQQCVPFTIEYPGANEDDNFFTFPSTSTITSVLARNKVGSQSVPFNLVSTADAVTATTVGNTLLNGFQTITSTTATNVTITTTTVNTLATLRFIASVAASSTQFSLTVCYKPNQ